ncbi:MAG: hypothetical protein NVSMB51_00210 [Solirubrobacteraceae bacterium]
MFMTVQIHTFMFADITGFTEFTCLHGDELAAELAVSFHDRVWTLAAMERCEVVKSIGDAVMLRASDCRDAVRLARQILMLSEIEGFPPIRIGIDTGPAVQRHGDWFGSTVNTAARVTGAAAPGELLLTERTRNAIDQAEESRYTDRGRPPLKGLPPSTVFACE